MKRRGFLGFIGGAAVAGPGMAKAAVSTGLEGLSIGNAAGFMGLASGENDYRSATTMETGEIPLGLPPSHPRHWAQRQLSEFMSVTADDLHEQRMRTRVDALDADLAVNRSYSLAAKMRIQRDRNFERDRAGEKHTIMRMIKDEMKRWAERDNDI